MKFRYLSHMCKVKLKNTCAAICTVPSRVRGLKIGLKTEQSGSRRCQRAQLYNRPRLSCTDTLECSLLVDAISTN